MREAEKIQARVVILKRHLENDDLCGVEMEMLVEYLNRERELLKELNVCPVTFDTRKSSAMVPWID